MRVLQISSTINYGGGERHLVDLCRGLHNSGHEVFVALRPTNQWGSHLGFLPAERIFHVSIRNSFGMFSAKRIARFIDRNKIDILHAHVARDYLAASVAARIAKDVRLVLTRHVVFPMKPFQRFALRNVAAAIAVSPAVEKQLQRIFPAESTHLIPNGIAMNNVRDGQAGLGAEFRRYHNIAADAPLIVTVGELKPVKGQRDFVLAADDVLKMIPNARFVIAGKDNTLDQKFRRELKRLMRVLGIEDSFLWLDWLDDLQPLLSAADLFVSPSHSESFGLAILEAMAAGTPVLATETDGARELIAEPDCLVTVRDPYTLSKRMQELVSDPARREQLGQTLRESAHTRFGVDTMIASTEQLYEKVLRKERLA